MKTDRPNYYAIIPASVRYDQALSSSAKLIYGEITALCNEKGYCWANNAYFGKIYGVHPDTASSWISELEKAGHIKIKGETTKRNIYLSVKTPIGKFTYSRPSTLGENAERSLGENAEHNNTSINNNLSTNVDRGEWTLAKAIQSLDDAPRRDLQIIALYFKERRVKFTNKGQFNEAIRRHIRAAKSLVHFSDEQIIAGAEKAKEKYPNEWTLETVNKVLTK